MDEPADISMHLETLEEINNAMKFCIECFQRFWVYDHDDDCKCDCHTSQALVRCRHCGELHLCSGAAR